MTPTKKKPRATMNRSHAAILAAFLSIGFIIRIFMAGAPGNEFDVGVNQGWGKSAMHFGIARSYEEQLNGNMLPNYAPFTIMLFTLMGYADEYLVPESLEQGAYRILIKLPAIAADLGAAVLAFLLVRRWKTTRHGLLAAGILSFHPAAFYESAVWGQTDSVYAFFVLACLWAYFDKHFFLAGIFMALSLLSKMQGVFIMPLLAVLFLRTTGWGSARAIAGGVFTLVLVFVPFIIEGNVNRVLDVYLNSVGFYPVISSAAYNVWWALYGDAAGTMVDTDIAVWPLTYRQTGLALFGASYAYATYAGWNWFRASTKSEALIPVVLTLSAFLAHSFFMLNTEMHERYLFPFVFLGIPMVFLSRHAAWTYAAISLLFCLNLAGWLPATSVDRALYAEFASFDIIIGVLQTVMFCHFVAILWKLRKKSDGRIAALLSRAVPFLKRV